MTDLSVCYMGAYAPDYPRNLILRRGLAAQGVKVVECNAPRSLNSVGRARYLVERFPEVADQCDVIVLAEFGQSLALTAWWMSRRYSKRLVIDAFTSFYDSAVHDRQVARPRSLRAFRYWLIDLMALQFADHVITDTAEHAAYFAHTYRVPESTITPVPVGAAREWFDMPPAKAHGEECLVQFFGSYIPLHGVESILHAAKKLENHTHIRFELIGGGQMYTAMRSLAVDLGLPDSIFREYVSPELLPLEVSRADICLGIFGTTDKAFRVVPNKVYETLALGKPVVTLDSPALRHEFTPGEHLLVVPPGDPSALADAVLKLVGDAELRSSLGRAGRERMDAYYDETALGKRLLDILA